MLSFLNGNTKKSSNNSRTFCFTLPSKLGTCLLYRFQIKDEIKAARIEAKKAYSIVR
jgi:hypothetical protein